MAGNRPIFTQNFSANLLAIQTFFGADGHQSFQGFLDRLFDEIVPRLCRFPKSGRSFLIHSIHSSEGKSLVKKLRRRLHVHDDLRECIVDEYLILYLLREKQIVFLSIKHHRELSFDLKRFWQET
jgi:plasmid stabilization system protein ParE